jgi:hypothetical protein
MSITTTESDGRARAPRQSRRLRIVLAAATAVVIAAAMYGWHVWADRQPTVYSAIDAYTAAVQSGDRAALEAIIAEGPGRQTLIERHAGRPGTVTGVTMEMSISAVMWEVELRYELPGQERASERLLAFPRSDSPDRLIDYAISLAP